MTTEKQRALELALGQIDRHFGRGTVMRLGEGSGGGRVDAIPTGSISLDMALGVGGIPKGRVTEVFGDGGVRQVDARLPRDGPGRSVREAPPPISTPSTRSIPATRRGAVRRSASCSSPSLTPPNRAWRYASTSCAAAPSISSSWTASPRWSPKAELEGDMGDTHVGLQARLMSQGLRKLTAAISRSNTAVVFINQIREKVGVFFGNPEVTPGGRALKFYSSVRIDIRRIESIKQAREIIGSRVRARIVKNKVAPPFRVAEFDIMFNEGISKEGDLIDIGADTGILSKSGSFYSFGETRLGQGRENSKSFLRDNPDVAGQIERLIRRGALPEEEAPPPPAPSENGAEPTTAGRI